MNSDTTHSAGAADLHAAPLVRDPGHSALSDGILEQARDLICERMDEAVASMLDKADESLLALIMEIDNHEERRAHEEAREVVKTQRKLVESQFQECYFEDFQQRCDRARMIGEHLDVADHSMDDLELVGKEDFAETLRFNDMAHKLRIYCEDELVALEQRVGLLLGDAHLEASENPFSPRVICDAFKDACRHLDADASVRRVLLKLFDDHVLDDVRSIYKAVNALLVRNAVLPKIRYGVARDPNRKATEPAASAFAEPGNEPSAAQITQVPAQDLFAVLQRLASIQSSAAVGPSGMGDAIGPIQPLAGAPGAAAAAAITAIPNASAQHAQEAASGVILQGTELLRSLTRIQHGDLSVIASGSLHASAVDPGTSNVLHELKATSVAAGMGKLDLLTLDIVAMLFDQLFDDPKVPNGVKGIIGRLQIPTLKVAIADKSFFSEKTHPARRLLDTVGEIALRLPEDFDPSHPLFERLQSILQDLMEAFQESLEPFDTARDRLLELIADEDRRIEAQTSTQAKRAEEMENLALAKSVAQAEIRARMQAQRLPDPIVDFLMQQWLKLLLLLHVKEGKEGASWKYALELMDRMIWSIAPKTTPEERRRLGRIAPNLVRNLTIGMRFIGTEDSVREEFLAELMKYHTQAIGALDQTEAVESLGKPPGQGRETRKPASGAKARAAMNRSLDFSSPVTVKNPYGGGEVSVDSQELDFTDAEIANRARARREESIRRALDTLGMGTWVEFTDPTNSEVRRAARLIFVSPRKTRYLFAVDRAGKQIIQCSRAEIGRRLRLGEIVKLDKPPEESLFDRIMNRLLGKLGGAARTSLFAS